MNIEFDPEKDAINQRKHGIPLGIGRLVIEHKIGETIDDRRDYGEVRMNAFGLIAGRLFVCTYTMRLETYRVISVRKASRQEQRRWLP